MTWSSGFDEFFSSEASAMLRETLLGGSGLVPSSRLCWILLPFKMADGGHDHGTTARVMYVALTKCGGAFPHLECTRIKTSPGKIFEAAP